MEVPPTRFPSYFQEGSTDREPPDVASVMGWGEHGGVLESSRDPSKNYGRFIPLYSRKRGKWAVSAPSPLLPPNTDCDYAPVTESDLVYKKRKFLRHTRRSVAGVTLAFSKQIGHFCWDYNSIAFQCMGRLLEPHCCVGQPVLLKGKIRKYSQQMTSLMESLQNVACQDCPFAHNTYHVRSLSYLTRDWIHDVPPKLLAELVNEGMAEDWGKLQFQASLTGGALSWTPYPGTLCGCLIYPRGAAMNRLHFQQLLLDQHGHEVKLQGDPAVFELTQPIQQVSTGLHERMSVGVRASYHLAAWSFSHRDPPKPLSVLNTRTPSTCINASPHVGAEFCVCTEGGMLYLWSVETGLQQVRQEADTLFFRDDPNWRWSDFTAHPRVLTFADRTGVQFADLRLPNSQGQDLFHIGQESSCRRGERVILPRCLRETNPAYCLVSTQFSLYIMDERFPLVPVAKWDHMLEGPPTYAGVIPGGVNDRSNKILLSTQHSQETLMMQYSSGHSGSCQLHLPAVYLPQISESLNHLAPLLPHHHDTVLQRLQSPLAGMAAASPQRAADCLVVFQLTTAGDLFFQRLSQKMADGSGATCGVRVEPTVSNSAPEEPSVEPPHRSEELNRSPGPDQQRLVAQSPSNCLLKPNAGFCSWLYDLYGTCTWREAVPRPPCRISALFPSNKIRESSQEVAKLRERLRDSMKRGALVPSVAAATPHRLEAVDPKNWKDPLGQRLTASWEGRLGLWWDDRLGRNKESKIRALREKRQRQKQLRSRSLSSLSRGFTASVNSNHGEIEASSLRSSGALSHDHSSLPSTSLDCVADASQVTVTSRLSQNSCAITSSQSLQAKGIPCERRQTLQDFLSFIGDSAGPPSLPGSQTLSQRSQPLSKRSRMGF